MLKENNTNVIRSFKIIPSISSDHDIVEISLRVGIQIRGPGLWKFNNSLIEDTDYCKEMKIFIEKIRDENANIIDLRVRFDYLKYEIMLYSTFFLYRRFSKVKAKILRDHEFNTVNKITELDDKIIEGNITDLEFNEHNNLKKDLEHIEEIKANGARVRSRLEQIFN